MKPKKEKIIGFEKISDKAKILQELPIKRYKKLMRKKVR